MKTPRKLSVTRERERATPGYLTQHTPAPLYAACSALEEVPPMLLDWIVIETLEAYIAVLQCSNVCVSGRVQEVVVVIE